MRLHDFSTLTFDCYGTLIDWEQGLLQALAPLLRAGNVTLPPRRCWPSSGGASRRRRKRRPACATRSSLPWSTASSLSTGA